MDMRLRSVCEHQVAEVENKLDGNQDVAGNCESGRADLISKNPAELSWFAQMSTPDGVNCKCSSDPAMKVA